MLKLQRKSHIVYRQRLRVSSKLLFYKSIIKIIILSKSLHLSLFLLIFLLLFLKCDLIHDITNFFQFHVLIQGIRKIFDQLLHHLIFDFYCKQMNLLILNMLNQASIYHCYFLQISLKDFLHMEQSEEKSTSVRIKHRTGVYSMIQQPRIPVQNRERYKFRRQFTDRIAIVFCNEFFQYFRILEERVNSFEVVVVDSWVGFS